MILRWNALVKLPKNEFRTNFEFDVVVNSNTMIRDHSNLTIVNSQYNSGGGLHPNSEAYRAMAAGFPIHIVLEQYI